MNKLTPGQNEKWKIKITGSKGKKEAAEMLASMYDASLDAFRANYWNFNIYPNYSYGKVLWNTDNSFTSLNSILYESGWNYYEGTPSMLYDRLNYFGFSLFGFGYARDGVILKTLPKSVLGETVSISAQGVSKEAVNEAPNYSTEIKKEREKAPETNFEKYICKK